MVADADRTKPAAGPCRLVPREAVVMMLIALGAFIAVGAGALTASGMLDASPQLLMIAYAAPVAGALFAGWLVLRRL